MSDHTPATLLGAIVAGMRRWPSFLWRLEAWFKGVQFEGTVLFMGRPLISVAKGARLVIGDGVQVNSSLRVNPLACPQPSVLRAMVPGAQLILARRVGLSATVICAGSSIEIGEGTIFGSGAMVMDNDFHVPSGDSDWADGCGQTARPIKIGRGVFIGARAIVLKGVTIGDRAVVGAGAIVTKDVPAGCIAVGNPARILPKPAGNGRQPPGQ
ncbi:MAG: acyltransferase [Verrucomicrobiota bacterium]|jgi:carbonic anhydrase/acetyltransferase-like protein (isoleucine patch superfamily)